MCLAFPVRVLGVDGREAMVDSQGERRKVNISMLSSVEKGDYILAHGDLAIQKLEKKDAEETLKVLNEICECQV
ncbi:MAG: HypC/HybG/HupF family hydrogenase formation chaperone [Candidatus Altiarchaeales archaeon]|nr:HypC/HybG/HupF family hydrogenase formation chaperone [Candidatus Altiarchaeales archaeon]MBD3416018.1 HypC/HybG/HupF family hydrogenase formation chaperone [Candidatus Altiarchaeales archaeon]